jgi:hypothetical protein
MKPPIPPQIPFFLYGHVLSIIGSSSGAVVEGLGYDACLFSLGYSLTWLSLRSSVQIFLSVSLTFVFLIVYHPIHWPSQGESNLLGCIVWNLFLSCRAGRQEGLGLFNSTLPSLFSFSSNLGRNR